MDKFWQKLGLSFLALCGWGAITIVMTSCAYNPKVPVIFVNMTGVLGQTTCDSAGNTAILVNMADPARTNAYGVDFITLHEQMHVTQIQREGSCRAFMKRYNEDKNFAFQMEAEAYCGEMEFRILKGWERSQLYSSLVTHFRGLYDWLTVEQIVEGLPCQGGRDEKARYPDLRK